MIKRRYRRQSFSADISLTPLIDVALTLLVVVMISAPAQHQDLKVNIAQEHSTSIQSPIVISLDHTQQLYVNQHPITMNNLTHTLKECAGNTVRIDIDKNLDCSLLIKIIGLVEQASCIECIAFGMNPT